MLFDQLVDAHIYKVVLYSQISACGINSKPLLMVYQDYLWQKIVFEVSKNAFFRKVSIDLGQRKEPLIILGLGPSQIVLEEVFAEVALFVQSCLLFFSYIINLVFLFVPVFLLSGYCLDDHLWHSCERRGRAGYRYLGHKGISISFYNIVVEVASLSVGIHPGNHGLPDIPIPLDLSSVGLVLGPLSQAYVLLYLLKVQVLTVRPYLL